jgi:hypothetical protein
MDLVLVAPSGAILRFWAILPYRYRGIKAGFQLHSRRLRSPPLSMGHAPAGLACNDAKIAKNAASPRAIREGSGPPCGSTLRPWWRAAWPKWPTESAFTLASQVSRKITAAFLSELSRPNLPFDWRGSHGPGSSSSALLRKPSASMTIRNAKFRILPPQPRSRVSVGVEKAKPIVVTQMVEHTDLFERA